MNLRRVRAMARKEFLHILRDRRSLLLALALPALMLLLFGWALSLDVDRIPTMILDMDGSPASRDVVSRFAGSRYFDLMGEARDYAAVERAFDRGECLMAVAILPGFQADLDRGRTGNVQLLVEGSDSNTASISLGYAETVLNGYALQVGRRQSGGRAEAVPAIDLRLRIWYNSELDSKNYIVPGLLAVILTIIAALLTSLTIARERELGSLEHLLSTPVRPAEIILGKMSAYFALGAVDTVSAVVFGVWIFGVPLRGSWLLLGLASFVFLFGMLCWGILISAISPSQLVAYQAGIITTFLPSLLLSGFVFAIANMPALIQAVTLLVPSRYFITILRGIFLKAVGFSVWGVDFILLAIFCSVVFLVAAHRLSKETI